MEFKGRTMKAMILAAGKGTRLLPLTGLRPKPLFPVYNTPLLDLTIHQLKQTGATDIIINTHHLNQHFNDYFKERTYPGVNLTFSHEPNLLGTAGAIKNVEEFWDSQPFIVINGDIIHTINLHTAYQHHMESGNLATLILHQYPRYNQVEIDQEGNIIAIRDERVRTTVSPTQKLAFTGIHILSPKLLMDIPPSCYVDIISVYLNLMSRGMKIGGHPVDKHYWLDIGTVLDYHRIHQDIDQKKICLNHLLSRPQSFSIGESTTVEGYVCGGKNTVIGNHCRIKNCIFWDRVNVDDHLSLEGCIIGDGVKVTQSLKNRVVVG